MPRNQGDLPPAETGGKTQSNGAVYFHIAQALARGYKSLYYVNLDTEEFIRYRPDEETGSLMLCYAAVAPGQNVTRRGDDVKRYQTVLQKGAVLSPAAVGVLAAMGVYEASVYAPLKIGVLSTGNEIVPIEQTPAPGEIRDVNSHLLLSLGRRWGCACKSYGVIPDEEDALTRALQTACDENDIVLLSGGSSAGPADKTAEITGKLGTVFCHGIAVKPGKPTVLGRVGDTAVFGLPGHPAACFFTASLLVKAHLDARTGRSDQTNTVKAKLTEHVSSNHGRAELLCVKLTPEGAVPVHAKSGVISVLSAADGYVIIPREAEGIRAGSEVEVITF